LASNVQINLLRGADMIRHCFYMLVGMAFLLSAASCSYSSHKNDQPIANSNIEAPPPPTPTGNAGATGTPTVKTGLSPALITTAVHAALF